MIGWTLSQAYEPDPPIKHFVDNSDEQTCRGKRTHENLAEVFPGELFNTMGHVQSFAFVLDRHSHLGSSLQTAINSASSRPFCQPTTNVFNQAWMHPSQAATCHWPEALDGIFVAFCFPAVPLLALLI